MTLKKILEDFKKWQKYSYAPFAKPSKEAIDDVVKILEFKVEAEGYYTNSQKEE